MVCLNQNQSKVHTLLLFDKALTSILMSNFPFNSFSSRNLFVEEYAPAEDILFISSIVSASCFRFALSFLRTRSGGRGGSWESSCKVITHFMSLFWELHPFLNRACCFPSLGPMGPVSPGPPAAPGCLNWGEWEGGVWGLMFIQDSQGHTCSPTKPDLLSCCNERGRHLGAPWMSQTVRKDLECNLDLSYMIWRMVQGSEGFL